MSEARRKDGLCPKCTVRERHDFGSYCRECKRAVDRESARIKARQRAPGRICIDCKTAPALLSGSYCSTCKAARWRRYNSSQPGAGVGQGKRRAGNPNACNCGDVACNGMRCERAGHARADTVAREAG